MIELWVLWMFFGHVFADYFLQPEWMAIKKKRSPSICNIHCAIYAVVVGSFVYIGGYDRLIPMQLVLLYISHYIIDGTNLLENYMKAIGIRSWDTHAPKDFNEWARVSDSIYISFGAIVYVVMDNTLHLFMTFLIFQYL